MKTLLRLFTFTAAVVLGSIATAAPFNTVIIDPGHGGQDYGGQWGKVYEKHLALDTATRLERRLQSLGFRTVMTRRSDYFVTLPERVRIANQYRNAIFVSVHFNYTWRTDAEGLETFFCNNQSAQLAQLVQRGMIRHTRAVDRQAKYARYYVIRNTNMPSILIEGGFVSNEDEREHMKIGHFRDAIAKGAAEGIYRFSKMP